MTLETPEDWQTAVDIAYGALVEPAILDGNTPRVEVCLSIMLEGSRRGIRPTSASVERYRAAANNLRSILSAKETAFYA